MSWKKNPIDNLYQEFPENIGQLSIEKDMSFYENSMPEIFKKIIKAESLNCLSARIQVISATNRENFM